MEASTGIAEEKPLAPDVVPSDSIPSARGTTAQCRFCLEESALVELTAPCQCSGTGRYVHARCLRKWQREVSKDGPDERAAICQACRCPFSLAPPPMPPFQARERRNPAPALPIFEQITTNPYFDNTLAGTLPARLRRKLVDCMRPGCLVLRSPGAAQPIIRGEHWNQGVFLIGGVFAGGGHARTDALIGVNVAGARQNTAEVLSPELNELQGALSPRLRLISGGPVKPQRILVVLCYRGELTEVLPALVRQIPPALADEIVDEEYPSTPRPCSGALFGEPKDILVVLRRESRLEPIGVCAYMGHAVWSDAQLLSEVARCNWGLTNARSADLALVVNSEDSGAALWNQLWETRDPLHVPQRTGGSGTGGRSSRGAAATNGMGCTGSCSIS